MSPGSGDRSPDLFLPLSSSSHPPLLPPVTSERAGLPCLSQFQPPPVHPPPLGPSPPLPHGFPLPPPVRHQMLEVTDRPPWLLHLPSFSSRPLFCAPARKPPPGMRALTSTRSRVNRLRLNPLKGEKDKAIFFKMWPKLFSLGGLRRAGMKRKGAPTPAPGSEHPN